MKQILSHSIAELYLKFSKIETKDEDWLQQDLPRLYGHNRNNLYFDGNLDILKCVLSYWPLNFLSPYKCKLAECTINILIDIDISRNVQLYTGSSVIYCSLRDNDIILTIMLIFCFCITWKIGICLTLICGTTQFDVGLIQMKLCQHHNLAIILPLAPCILFEAFLALHRPVVLNQIQISRTKLLVKSAGLMKASRTPVVKIFTWNEW